MTEPTIESRLKRRLVLATADAEIVGRLRAALPPGWELTVAGAVEQLGDFAELLQHRFMLVDLDAATIDPPALVRTVRSGLMLNIAIFCFGGSAETRAAARLARADRFFEADEIAGQLPVLCGQFGW